MAQGGKRPVSWKLDPARWGAFAIITSLVASVIVLSRAGPWWFGLLVGALLGYALSRFVDPEA